MFGPVLFLCFRVCREMNAVGARIPGDELDLENILVMMWVRVRRMRMSVVL